MGEKLEDSVVTTEVKDVASSKGKNKERIEKFQGNVAELGVHVFTYGSTNFGDRFVKNVEAIAEYVG